MKTLEEIYTEVLENEGLKSRFQTLKTPEEQAAFVKELGGEATAEEIAEFLDKQNNKTGELSDDELDQVVGGKSSNDAKYIHNNCGGEILYRPTDIIGGSGECYCNKCGETHGSRTQFSYHME